MKMLKANRKAGSIIGVFALSFFITQVSLAQVRIGEDTAPVKGAVLDLSNTSDGYIGGLKLPNVSITSLTAIPGSFKESVSTPEEKKALTGLLVYNTNTSTGVGIYYWDGTKWIAQGTADQEPGQGTGVISLTGSSPIVVTNGTSSSPSLSFMNGTTSGQVLRWNGSEWAPATDNNTTYTATNGLTLNGTAMELGGTLTKATTVTSTSTNKLTLGGTGTGNGAVTISAPLAITSGTPGANKVLTSDASGNATWATPTDNNTTYTGTNGLTLNSTAMELGGTLTKATTIANGGSVLTLSGTGRTTISTPTTISGALLISSGTPGANKVLTSDASGNATWVAPTNTTYTAANGLTLNGTAMELGGTLTKATTVTSTSTNKLTLGGTGTGNGAVTISAPLAITSGTPGANKVLTSDASGNATWVAPTNTTYTAANGLTLNGTAMELGGTLTKATTVTSTSTNKLTLGGTGTGNGAVTISAPLAITSGTPGANKVLTSDASGNATWAAAPTNTTYTAVNGLTLNGTAMELGGALTKATTVTSTSTYKLTLGGTGTGNGAVTISAPLAITSGTPGANKVLTSDASGNATWSTDQSWKLTGNSVASSDFLGTTNNLPLIFKVYGTQAGRISNTATGANSFGYGALPATSTGTNNNAFGYNALKANTSGVSNTAIGNNTLSSNTTGNSNIAIGNNALPANTTGASNLAVGGSALLVNTGERNLAVGSLSLQENTTGGNNVAIGIQALGNITTSQYNTGVGHLTGLGRTSGNYNVFLGYGAGSCGAGATGNNNVLIGYDAGNITTWAGKDINNRLVIANNGGPKAWIMGIREGTDDNVLTYTYRVGINGDYNSSYVLYSNGAAGGSSSWGTASDRRLKDNILGIKYGLSEVIKLNPVSFTMKESGEKRIGFIAQDVQKIVPEVVNGVEGDLEKGETLSIAYSDLIPVLTKAIQEQQKIIEQLEVRLKALETSK